MSSAYPIDFTTLTLVETSEQLETLGNEKIRGAAEATETAHATRPPTRATSR